MRGSHSPSWAVAYAPAESPGDPAGQLSARLVAGIVDLLLVAEGLFTVAALSARAPLPGTAKVTLAAGFVLLGGLRVLVRSGRVRLAAIALCVVAWLAVATDLPVHGQQTVSVGGFMVLVVIGGLAVGPAAAIALAAATVALLALVLLGIVPVVSIPVGSGALRFTHYATQLTLAATLVAWWASHMRALLQQLRASEAQHTQLLEASPDAIVRLDAAGVVTFCNSAVERILGYAPRELVGHRWEETPTARARDVDALRAKVAGSLAGKVFEASEMEVTHREGHVVILDTKAYPIQEADGRIVGLVAILRDVSDRRKEQAERRLLREQLVTAQRMEAVGRFAGGIAHDFNNILTVILNATELVGRGNVEADARALDDARDAATRGAALTKQLLTFGRGQSPRPQATDPSRAAAALRPMLDRLIAESVEIRMDLDRSAPAVLIDPGQLDQVLLNMVVNARDAMPGGGAIRIATGRAVAADGEAHVVIEISDDGSGMDETTMAHMFEPFFTTKGDHGTGLGLAVVHDIVHAAGGTIACESQPGAGTTFRIELPASDIPAAPTPVAPPVAAGSPRRVVLVDDDPLVRSAVARSLEAEGVLVDVIAPPLDVTAIMARLRVADALVTDIAMPGMTGPDLVEELRRRGSMAPVVFVTGHAEHALLERARNAPRSLVVSKPFTPQDVLARIDELRRAAAAKAGGPGPAGAAGAKRQATGAA